MKKGLGVTLAFVLLSVFFIGCANNSKEQWIKCPKCGAYFSTKEGAEFFKLGEDRY